MLPIHLAAQFMVRFQAAERQRRYGPSLSRESTGKRRKWLLLAEIALLVLLAVGLLVLSQDLIAGASCAAERDFRC
jgi:hypothetical protein